MHIYIFHERQLQAEGLGLVALAIEDTILSIIIDSWLRNISNNGGFMLISTFIEEKFLH